MRLNENLPAGMKLTIAYDSSVFIEMCIRDRVNSSFAINPGVYRNLGFAPKRDFAAVINVAFVPSVFVVPAASPLHTLDDARNAARPERPLPFASCGNGTPQHLAGEMLTRATGAPLQHVPYKLSLIHI